MNIKVISFDIFQTLVDVNKRIPQIWQGILGEAFTCEAGHLGANAIIEAYPGVLHKALNSDRFYTMEELYYDCAVKVVAKTGFSITADTVLHHILVQHSKAPMYEDVLTCMQKLRGKYKIILSSDSNHQMIDDLLPHFIYDEVFISDDLSSYKGSHDGSFFRQVVKYLQVAPAQILHIGDSSSDVFGAFRAGVNSCWLNREQSVWKHDIQPDFVINSLSEIPFLLGTE